MFRRVAALAALAAIVPLSTAVAHTGVGPTTGFAHGFLHPFGGADHLLAMVAVGLLAGIHGGRAVWLLPAGFLGTMIAGAGFGGVGLVPPGVEPVIALSVVVIAGLAAGGQRLPGPLLLSVVAGFALFHGMAHGAEIPARASGLLYGAGFTLATALLHALGLAVSLATPRLLRAGAAPVRLAAAAISIAGVALFVRAF